MKILYWKICRSPHKWLVRNIFHTFFIGILCVLILVAVLAFLTFALSNASRYRIVGQILNTSAPNSFVKFSNKYSFKLIPLSSAPLKRVTTTIPPSVSTLDGQRVNVDVTTSKCSFFNCFDLSRCGRNGQQKLSIYIYPIQKFIVDGQVLLNSISREFYEFLDAIRQSQYYVPTPEDACLFVPSIDTLQLQKSTASHIKNVEAALSSLEFWRNDGENHFLISMFPANSSLLSLKAKAIVAASGIPVESYGLGFHVPLISYNPILRGHVFNASSNYSEYFRNPKIVAVTAHSQTTHWDIETESVLVLGFCKHKRGISYRERCRGRRVFPYPEVLNNADFCLVLKDLAGPLLWDVMSAGCIPVIITDFQRLPFDEVIDWKRNAILLYEYQLPHLLSILQSVSPTRVQRLKSQVQFTFNNYFKSMYHITASLLDVLNDRVFSHYSRSLWNWNYHPQLDKIEQPLFNPVIAPKDAGFTAVILAYERVPSLFQVIERISLVPSLGKIIVVWNNQVKAPPTYSTWPQTQKIIKVIKMDRNKMSNRFFPFDEIETEAVFSVDDDIIMLTVDEIEFGFQTWREFPDRIVGFPSRSHVWDNSSRRWKYESEWTNEISMVLTGAAFYHKYWHHAYTSEMSVEIRDFVDAKMNCEDIAMNFLVAAKTGQSPIKVTPRKKFKCPTCSNNEMLSSDSSHMVERTDCINKFVQIYGYMPLIVAEFRADPVLYKVDNLSHKLKKFQNIGNL